MIRTMTRTLLALAVMAGTGRLSAEEIRGKVKSVDGEKNTITLTVGEADRTFQVVGDAKVVGLYGKKLKKAVLLDVTEGLRGIKDGADVTVATIESDAKAVSKVKVEDLQPKVKKKKKKKAK